MRVVIRLLDDKFHGAMLLMVRVGRGHACDWAVLTRLVEVAQRALRVLRCLRIGHRDDGVSAVPVFECVQQGEFAQLNRTRSSLVDLRYKVEPGGITLTTTQICNAVIICLTAGRKLSAVGTRRGHRRVPTRPRWRRPSTGAPPSGNEAGIAVEDGSERLRENTAKIIPFETAEPQANTEKLARKLAEAPVARY